MVEVEVFFKIEKVVMLFVFIKFRLCLILLINISGVEVFLNDEIFWI